MPTLGTFRKYASLFVFAPVLLFGQGAPSAKSVPDDVLFHFFFQRFSTAESAAASQRAGESTASRALRSQAGLSDVELSLLKEVVLSCNDLYDAKTRTGAAEVRALAAQNPRGQAPPAAVAARINALERERAKVVMDCADSLKRGLGAAKYASFANFVRAQGAGIRYVDPSMPDVTSKNPPLPGMIPTGNPNQGGMKQ